jgi:hypothetical protein
VPLNEQVLCPGLGVGAGVGLLPGEGVADGDDGDDGVEGDGTAGEAEGEGTVVGAGEGTGEGTGVGPYCNGIRPARGAYQVSVIRSGSGLVPNQNQKRLVGSKQKYIPVFKIRGGRLMTPATFVCAKAA